MYRQLRLRRTRLTWLDRTGKELATIGEPSYHAGVHLGADGHTLVAIRSESAGGNADVWTLDLRSCQATRSTFLSAPSTIFAAVSPDGARMAVATPTVGGSGGATLWIQPTSGSGSRQPLFDKGSFNVADWSKDGAYLIGDTQEAESGFDVAYVALKDSTRTVHLTTSRFDERLPALSPNGRWMAYQSNETGRLEIFVTDFPAASRKWQLSRSGGEAPSWRSDGRELYFSSSEEAFAVGVTERNGALEAGTPERLPFPKETFRLDAGVAFSDGKRFVVERFASDDVTEPIRLIRSWRRIVEK